MATYISLVQYTQKGIEAIKESPKRLDVAREAFQKAGAKLKEFYLVMGEYDIVIVVDAPNDETVAKVSLMLGSKGNVRTRTMRAFTETEYRSLIQSLP
jgi:uncharacterized protein with GYD domain